MSTSKSRSGSPIGTGPNNRNINLTAEDARTEQLLSMALEATSDGIWSWHVPSGETYFSPRYYTMLGYEPDEFPASYDTWVNLLHPDDAEQAQEIIQKHIDRGTDGYEVEFRLQTKSGRYLWILGRGKVIEWDEEGRPILVVGSHVNIDSRKRVEGKLANYRAHLEKMVNERTKELEQTMSLLEATFDAIPDVLGVQDDEHHIIRYNAAGYRFLDMTPDEVRGKKCYQLIGRKMQCEQCATSECYRTKKPASVKRYEDSLDVWLDVRAYPILDNSGKIVKVIEHLRDITPEVNAELENRKLHEQLQQAQKMESLGTLAGGIAHDFNNLMMGIQGRASLLSVDLPADHPHKEHLDAIQDHIRSAKQLTKQLLGFARGGKYEVTPLDLNELVDSSASLFGRTRKEIQVNIHLHDQPLIVEADRGQIEQVLLNMYVNAWQAMPGGGHLDLVTQCVSLDEAQCEPHGMMPGRYARLSIRDTGIGMDEPILQRIFDPFFTTKDKSRGTGLGLASAYGIITNHGGKISVDSRPGRGTTFKLYLPVSNRQPLSNADTTSSLIMGRETILLIDDEPMILDVGQAMLQRLGYDVLIAQGGSEALTLVDSDEYAIDLVILDLIMPGLDGGRVFDRIREIRPAIPILLSSGYAIDGQAEAIMQRGCQGFIQKPFNINTLSHTIRKVLDKSGE